MRKAKLPGIRHPKPTSDDPYRRLTPADLIVIPAPAPCPAPAPAPALAIPSRDEDSICSARRLPGARRVDRQSPALQCVPGGPEGDVTGTAGDRTPITGSPAAATAAGPLSTASTAQLRPATTGDVPVRSVFALSVLKVSDGEPLPLICI